MNLAPQSHTTPFAQQSPPPRRKPPHGSSNDSVLQNTANSHPRPRSRIPFQWRVGDHAQHAASTLLNASPHFQSLAPPTGQSTTAKFGNIFSAANISSAATTKERPTPRKLSSITSFLRSHSTSSDQSSASSSSCSSSSSPLSVLSPSLDPVELHQDVWNPSIIHPSCSAANSDDRILETQCSSSSPPSPTRPSKFTSSSSFHPSVDSEFQSFEDEEVLSAASHPHLRPHLPPRSVKTPTPSHAPESTSNSTPTSNSFHHLPPSSQSSTSNPSHCHHPSPRSPSPSSRVSHATPPSVTELPFACPSPVLPIRSKNRPTRPVPTRAPPLPRSQTPSLVIRPKFSLSSSLDLAIRPIPSHFNSNVPSRNVSIDPPLDLDKRPLSNSKTDMIRDLGLGPSPMSPRCPPSPALLHFASSSGSLIDFITPELTTAQRSLGPELTSSTDLFNADRNRSSSPPRQIGALRTKTKKFRDRFTLTNTAPLKISKRQKTHHSDNLASTSDAGRRIVSGLLNVLSPTSATHDFHDPVNERRKAEFKKKISYPVLNHASGEDTLSQCGQEDHHDDDTDCYNLTIEAAVRSLEGIRSNGSSPRLARRVPSNMVSSNRPQGAPDLPNHYDKNLDPSAVASPGDSVVPEEMTQIWKSKLRRRMSSRRLMTKSNKHQVGDDEIESDCQSPGVSRQFKGAHKHLRSKASARLKPLLHRVSSLSLRQRAYASESEAGPIFETGKVGKKVDEQGEEEELVIIPDQEFDMDMNPIPGDSEFKPDSRFRWIRSSLSKKQSARSIPLSTVDLTTPKKHQDSTALKPSSQSIREKRKIFEPEAMNQSDASLPDLPMLPASSSALLTPSDQFALSDVRRLSTDPVANKRSIMLSQRQAPNRKPTPAEIKLKDETRSVKALVNKFEHQSHCSLPRSLGSDCHIDSTSQRTWDGGRASSGFVRNSLASIWSGGGSSNGKNASSTRSSKQLAREQRRKRRGWSSGYAFSDAGECTNDGIPARKLKQKKKKKQKTWSRSMFQNDDSSFSSFGCDLQERDEEDFDTGPISDHTELTDSNELSSYHLATMLSTSSNNAARSTWSGLSSRDISMKNSGENPTDFNRQSSQSSSNAGFHSVGSGDEENQVGPDHEPRASSVQQLLEPENDNENKTWSLLSSEQVPTVLEPHTVWMGDGSARKILIVGARLQMAKKIPFPSFEDDAEFSQPINLQQPPSATKEHLSSKPIQETVQKNEQSNRISSFLRTRKFDDDELEEDEECGKDDSDDCHIRIGSKLTEEDLGSRMMCAAVTLQDSPTHGRGRRSLRMSMTMSASERSHSGSPERPRLVPHLLLDPASDVGEKGHHLNTCSVTGSPNSVDMKQMYLSVDRCQGLGSKMFGSSINDQIRISPPSSSGRCSGRRSASAIISCSLFRFTPPKSRPKSQPPMPTSNVNAILDRFDLFDSVNANQTRSPYVSTTSRSSILGCDILDRAQNENSTGITDLMEPHEGISALKQSSFSSQRASSAQLDHPQTPKSIIDQASDDELQNLKLDTVDANEVLKFELARLERVQEKWRKFCLEVEDVLKKSRERWPEHIEPDKVLGEFRRPTTKSTFEMFLANSRHLHRSGSVHTTKPTRLPQSSCNAANSQLTPPSKHPFDSRPITPLTVAGYPSLSDSGRNLQRSPHVVTLPVPSAFVSPERFLGGDKIPKVASERGPRVLKISNRSRHHGLRQQTLSNRLGSTDFKLATDRHRKARMISVTSSNGSFNSAGKAVLVERSVNQSPIALHNSIRKDVDDKVSSSPKIAGNQNITSAASLGRSNRFSPAKWTQENEGSQLTSVSMRETRKPWKRSILNPTSHAVSHHGAQDDLLNSSFASSGTPEEVGVLVADGDQPHEFSDGFHTSGSLRLKHLRRLHQSRSDRSIGKASRRIHSKSSKAELGVANASICKKTSLQIVNKHSSEAKSFVGNHVESNKKKSQITAVPLINHRI